MASEAPPPEGEAVSETELLEIQHLSQFLLALAPLLLDGDPTEFRTAVTRNESVLRQFISDAQTPLLLVQHILPTAAPALSETEEPSSPPPAQPKFSFDISMHFSGNAISLALIKKTQQLEAGKSVASQLQVINLGCEIFQSVYLLLQYRLAI